MATRTRVTRRRADRGSQLKSNPATHDTIVVALTVFAMKNDQQMAFNTGRDSDISKPIATRTFPEVVRQYLSQGRETSNDPKSTGEVETADLEPSLGKLCQTFVVEGIEQSGRLISTLGDGFDYVAALNAAHRWAGAAGSIGYPEITQIARNLEAELRQNGSGSATRTRELLVRLARLFTEALEREPPDAPLHNAASTPPAPQSFASAALISTLAGKKFALAGFPQEEATRLARALDNLQAFSRDLGAGGVPDVETVRPFDVIILNVASEVQTLPQWNKPVLVIGTRDTVLRLQPSHNGAEDFLFSPWTADEVILRSYFVMAGTAQGRESQTAPAAAGKRRVVVADDDSTIRALLEAAIEKSGLDCRVAGDGGEALQIIRSWQPELVVLDVNMPNRNGFEVLSSLRNDPLTRDIRVILLTARQQETDVIRGFGLGTDDYVIKPFSPMELIARLKRLLAKSA